MLLGLLLMLIVLIQRGKGGGLAGAFGGVGGSSPFGSRAADQFVKITLYLAAVWVLVIMINVKVVQWDVNSRKKTPAAAQLEPSPLRSAQAEPMKTFERGGSACC
jgi:preprotein translocase subunit SecG